MAGRPVAWWGTWDDLSLQGEERMDRQLLDAEMLAGHLVPKNSMFAFLAARRAEVFPDEEFADLFPSGRGRPSIPLPCPLCREAAIAAGSPPPRPANELCARIRPHLR